MKDVSTIQLSKETIRKMRIKKALCDKESYEELIIWMMDNTEPKWIDIKKV